LPARAMAWRFNQLRALLWLTDEILQKGEPSDAASTVAAFDNSTVKFVDSTIDKQTLNIGTPITQVLTGVIDSEIRELLMRPIKIFEFTWDGSNLSFNCDLWDLWFKQAPVARKIANHYLITTGGLNVRFVSNGSPFQYGRYGVAYWPYNSTDSYATGAAVGDITKFSTLPLFSTVDPAADSVIEWKIPEVKKKELRTTTAPDKLGSILGLMLARLQMAQTGSPFCDITVYASAVDPHLQGLTWSNAFYGSSKSGGSISGPLDKISKAADMVSTLPVIGPFMTSAGMAAKLGSRVAKLFGFSRPIDEKTCTRMTMNYVGFAAVDGTDVTNSLSLNSAPQTIIDPSYLGLDSQDEMSFEFIKRRWSMLRPDNAQPGIWIDTDAIGTVLFNFLNTPLLRFDVNTYPYTPSNVEWLSNCHTYWRGTMEYKFTFCASKFHTGRVKVFFDPDPNFVAPGVTTDATSVQKTLVIDLAEQREVVFTVPFISQDQWASTSSFAGGSVLACWGKSANMNVSGVGNVRMEVLSKLRAGINATSISILVSVRGGPDLEWANPSLLNWRDATNEISYSAAGTPSTAPVNAGFAYLGTSVASTAYEQPSDVNINVVASMTERVTSLRQHLKRYQFTRHIVVIKSGTNFTYTAIRDMPPQSGYALRQGNLQLNTNPWCHFQLFPSWVFRLER